MENSSPPFSTNKKLGQHFLNDQKIIDTIINALPSKCASIVEVGPGPGVLTRHLAEKSPMPIVVELDDRFKHELEKLVGKENVIIANALEVNWKSFQAKYNIQKPCALISNLPYNIASPLLVEFIKSGLFKNMVLMFQKEVALKVLKIPHSQEDHSKNKIRMNSLGALTWSQFEVRKELLVRPSAFKPNPQVDSLVLSFSQRDKPLISLSEIDRYERFLRQLFKHKRKQLYKVLKEVVPEEQINIALSKLNIDHQVRAETFTLDMLLALYKEVKEFYGN